jgi:hypothetical protein
MMALQAGVVLLSLSGKQREIATSLLVAIFELGRQRREENMTQ